MFRDVVKLSHYYFLKSLASSSVYLSSDTVSLSVSDRRHPKRDLSITTSPEKFVVLGAQIEGRCKFLLYEKRRYSYIGWR